MQLQVNPSKFLYLKWVSATAVGLALGIALNSYLPTPPYLPASSLYSILSLVSGWRYIIVGISVGVAQGLVIRKTSRGLLVWTIATTLGLTLAIDMGRATFGTFFDTIVRASWPNSSVSAALISAELLSGIVFGLIIGLAQWLAVRGESITFRHCMMISILAWSAALMIECLLVISTTLPSSENASDLRITLEPLILGFENVLIGIDIVSAQYSFAIHDNVAAMGIILITGSVVGAITGIPFFLQGTAFLHSATANWKRQNLVTKLSSILGVGVVVFCLGLALFLVTKEFDALALTRDASAFNIPTTGGGGCMSNFELQPERRVVKENESIPIYAKMHNSQELDCPVVIEFRTTDFEFAPQDPSQSVSIPPHQTATLMWMIKPKQLGTYSIGISAGLNSRITAISVVNMFGLTAQQAKVLSLIGTFFGPALTFPWLFSLWQQKRENAQKQTAEEQINNLRQEVEELKRRKRIKRN